jgi:hypothetical protein
MIMIRCGVADRFALVTAPSQQGTPPLGHGISAERDNAYGNERRSPPRPLALSPGHSSAL